MQYKEWNTWNIIFKESIIIENLFKIKKKKLLIFHKIIIHNHIVVFHLWKLYLWKYLIFMKIHNSLTKKYILISHNKKIYNKFIYKKNDKKIK